MFDTEKEFYYSTATDRYALIEKQCMGNERKCINGRVTGSNKCVGYCQYEEHPGFLTKELRRQHDCIKKKCCYYIGKSKN